MLITENIRGCIKCFSASKISTRIKYFHGMQINVFETNKTLFTVEDSCKEQ